jgi:uncharacterized protein YndB with AHSA1/START domain
MTDSTGFDVEITLVFDAPRERLYAAFTQADQLARWYGPDGFPVDRDTVAIDARTGGQMRLTMVSDSDPAMRTGVTGRFTRVVANELLECTQEWDGVPGQEGTWTNQLRVELTDDDGRTRLVLREGPHPPGTADIGRQAWLMMFAKLAALVEGRIEGRTER